MTRHSLPIGLSLAAVLAGTIAVQAAAATMAPASAEELTYKSYHEGVYAAVECRGAVFTPADHMVLERRIEERSGIAIHSGRQLDLIQAAKVTINNAMSHAGCAADEVQGALVRFDTIRGYQPK